MFSIVIPLFNKRSTIRQTIASVLGQTFRDFELIVVDDGSTDGSSSELTRVSDSRLKLIRQENLGGGLARNRGIEEAQSAWVAFVDADDVWMPYHLEELDRIRALFPNAGLIATRWKEADLRAVPATLPRESGQPEEVCYFEQALSGPVVCSSTVAIQRRVYAELGGFTAAPIGADIEYWARVALKWPVARSPVTTAYYLRPGKLSGVRSPVHSRPEVELEQGVAPVIRLLHSSSLNLPPRTRVAIERYAQALWTSRFRYLLLQRDLPRARLLSSIAPRKLAMADRLGLFAIRLPAWVAVPSVELARRLLAVTSRFRSRRAPTIR